MVNPISNLLMGSASPFQPQIPHGAMPPQAPTSETINTIVVHLRDLRPLNPTAEKEASIRESSALSVSEVAQSLLSPSPNDPDRTPVMSGVRGKKEKKRPPSLFDVSATPIAAVFSVSSFTSASVGPNESREGTLSCGPVSGDGIDQVLYTQDVQDAQLLKVWPKIFHALSNDFGSFNSAPLLKLDASADEIRAWLQPQYSKSEMQTAEERLKEFDNTQAQERRDFCVTLETMSPGKMRKCLKDFDAEQVCAREASEVFKRVADLLQAERRGKSLEGIRSLDLSGLELEMIPLELLALKGLQDLDLSGNKIKDVSFFKKFNELQEAHRLSMLSKIQGLKSTIRNAHLFEPRDLENRRREINGLENKAAKLHRLDLSHNEIKDVSGLGGLNGLITLNLSHNKIQSVDCLKNLSGLGLLYMSHNQIQDVKKLSALRSLQALNLSHNQIQDVTSLRSMAHMNYLILSDNQIQDIDPLRELSFLRTLNLARNPLVESEAVTAYVFRQLAHLNLSGTGMCSVDSLALLRAPLESLNLSDNQIEDTSSLKFPYLKKLDLSSNPVVHAPVPPERSE